jgi:hypothetical protein
VQHALLTDKLLDIFNDLFRGLDMIKNKVFFVSQDECIVVFGIVFFQNSYIFQPGFVVETF